MGGSPATSHRGSSRRRATRAPQASLLLRFNPSVRAYSHPRVDPSTGAPFTYRLRDDLDRIERNLGNDPKTVVSTCAEIAEVLCERAVALAKAQGIKPRRDKHNLAWNIDHLRKFRLMPSLVGYWTDNLRHLGNAAKHRTRPITAVDADLATAFLEVFLAWFFCDFEHQLEEHRCERLHARGCPPPIFERGAKVRRLMDQIGNKPPAFHRLLPAARAAGGLFHRSPVFATLTAEKLIAARRLGDAQWVLETARKRNPAVEKDFRFRQLMGLCHSRAGRLDEAVPWLTGICDDFTKDPETVGILGGVYKRRYLALVKEERHNEAARSLQRSLATYDTGWQATKPANYYLGINVAALTLWQLDLLGARATAGTIAAELEDMRDRILAGPEGLRDCFDLWDELSLLEAWIILGRFDEARAGLERVEAMHGSARPKDIATFREQARRNMRALRELGATELLEDYFGVVEED